MYLLRKGVLIALIIGVITAIGVGYQSTRTVCPAGPPTCDFTSIQAALAVANERDTIVVKPGIYQENPVITTSQITLRGEDPRAVRLEAAEPVHALEIQAVGVTVEGLTIRGAGRGQSAGFAGIYVTEGGAILRRNILQDNNIGIKVVNAAREPRVQILENTFMGNDKDIDAGGRTLIQGNKFDGELAIMTGGYAEIRENQGPILLVNGAAVVEDNRFVRVKIFSSLVTVFEDPFTTILRRNQIIGLGQNPEETGTFEFGLEIKTSAPVIVEENLISRQGASAIFIDEPLVEIILRRNTITNNGNGLWLLAQGEARNLSMVRLEGNTIERNRLWAVQLSAVDTTTQVELVNNLIRLNQGGGVMVGAAGKYRLDSNRITDNDDWGVVALIPPCVQEDLDLGLRPQVTGSGNEIANNGKRLKPEEKQRGDGEGNVCPKELTALKK